MSSSKKVRFVLSKRLQVAALFAAAALFFCNSIKRAKFVKQ